MRFLLDTNVISEMTKPQPSESVLAWLSQTPLQEIAISVLTLGEIRRGILADPNLGRQQRLQDWYEGTFLKMFDDRILDITPLVIEEWAKRYQQARLSGKTPATMDSLIAATAAAYRLSIVTRNENDFKSMNVPILNIWKPRDHADRRGLEIYEE